MLLLGQIRAFIEELADFGGNYSIKVQQVDRLTVVVVY